MSLNICCCCIEIEMYSNKKETDDSCVGFTIMPFLLCWFMKCVSNKESVFFCIGLWCFRLTQNSPVMDYMLHRGNGELWTQKTSDYSLTIASESQKSMSFSGLLPRTSKESPYLIKRESLTTKINFNQSCADYFEKISVSCLACTCLL